MHYFSHFLKIIFSFQEAEKSLVSSQAVSVSSFTGLKYVGPVQNSYRWVQFWKGGLWFKVLSHPHWTWKATRNSPRLLCFSGTIIDTFPLVCPEIWIWLNKQMSAAEAAGCRAVFMETGSLCPLKRHNIISLIYCYNFKFILNEFWDG